MHKKVLDLIVQSKKLMDKDFNEAEYIESVKSEVSEETKANEVMHTTNTGFGAELIPTNVMLDPLLDLVPEYSKLLPLLPGNHGNDMPISAKVPVLWEANMFGWNAEWTTGAWAFITPANKGPATWEVTITQGQYILTVSISKRELNYWPAQLEALIRERINRAAARTIDAVIINGDAETSWSGNVNLVDSTPTTWIYYLQNDHWIRELAINNSQTVSVGSLTSGDFLDVLSVLSEWYQSDLDNLLFLMPANVYNKSLLLSEVLTMEKFGPDATIRTGVLAKVFGIDIITARDRPAKAKSNGTVSNTSGNNTTGSFGLIYKPAVQYWFGQPLEIDVFKVPGKWVDLVATFEFWFAIANNCAWLGNTVAAWINVTL